MIVLKFGGSSVADAACMRQVAGLVKAALPKAPLVVLSAMGKTTNGLFDAAKAAEAGDLTLAMERQRTLMASHRQAATDLFDGSVPEVLDEALTDLFGELELLLRGVALLRELSPRSMDAIASLGERLSQHRLPDCRRLLRCSRPGHPHAVNRRPPHRLPLRHLRIHPALRHPLHPDYGPASARAQPNAACRAMNLTAPARSPLLGVERHRIKVIVAFALVYVFWGSTYLAIRITSAEGIPPLVMCAMRFLIAGPVMLLACSLFGRNIRITLHEAFRLAAIGVLLLVGGNGTLAWAEQYVPTGFAALIIAVTPIWFLVLETFVFGGDRISRRGIIGLVMGIIGIVILVWPRITHRESLGAMQLLGALSLLFSSLSWAVGSVLSRQWHMKVDPLVATGWQMLFASLVAFRPCPRHRTSPPRLVQPARSHGRALSCCVRLLGRIHRLRLAAQARAHAQGRHVRLREPHCRRDFRCDRAARTRRSFHARRNRRDHRCSRAGHHRQDSIPPEKKIMRPKAHPNSNPKSSNVKCSGGFQPAGRNNRSPARQCRES